MARVLVHAISACMLVVYLASDNRVLEASSEARGLHVGKGTVAAGRAHSVIATPEGRVSAWGSGRRGQIGDGALVDRWSPTPVSGIENIVAVTAGAAHTVAVTSGGSVYAWGANSFGRLGDGTTKRRVTPVRVRGLTNVTMVAAGRAHTLALTADGRVYAWGRNTDGQLGIGNRAVSLVPVQVRDLGDVVSIAAGDAHSLAVTRSGRLFAWGSNQFSMLGDGTTKDRLVPVAIAISEVVAVAGGAAHSIALLRNGSVFSWGRGANGELGSGVTRHTSKPAMVPGLKATAIAAGRHFSAAIREDGSVVAWGANDSGQLGDRSKLQRARPVVVDGLSLVTTIALGDAHAIAVTASGDVRTWGAGEAGQLGNGSAIDRAVPSEVISDIPHWGLDPDDTETPPDVIPPSIVASVSPPLTDAWMTTPVTVTFRCADDVGIRSCPAPVTVSTDGFAQRVTGTAVDLAGNQATAAVVVNLDVSPPVLTLTDPQPNATTSETEITVSGLAIDAGSGVAAARCNGLPAQIVSASMRCAVALRPGRNQIVVQVFDAVGFSASTAATVTRVGVASTLALTPATRTLEVNEVATLSLRDEFGVRVGGASWTTDADLVELSDDDPPQITARALGTATVTATKDGRTAVSTIVVSPGLSAGDARWSLPVAFEYSVDLPLFANRTAPDVPLLFAVEAKGPSDVVVRAISLDGESLWQQRIDAVPIMGDSFGGFIAGVGDATQDFRAYLRLGDGSIRPWRYDSAGYLGRPAQAHDGTIYAIERLFAERTQDGFEIWDKHALVIDGATGRLISSTLLAREISNFYSDRDGEPINEVPPGRCFTSINSNAPETLEPVAGSDGRGYLVVRRFRQIKHGDCYEQIYALPDRSIDMGLDLVVLSRTALPVFTNFHATTCGGAFGTRYLCDYPVHAVQVMPDGAGGTLITWERGGRIEGDYIAPQRWLTRVTADGVRSERPVADQFSLELIGQDGMAIASDDGWKAFDVESGNTTWAMPPDLVPLAARPDGGVAALDASTGDLRLTGSGGVADRSQSFGLWWSAHEGGEWIGFRDTHLTAVVGEFSNATRFSAMQGNAQGQRSPRRPGLGLFAKTHLALPSPGDLLRYRHVSIRVVPEHWQKWIESGIELRGTDEFGNGYFTLGAGSNSTDTNLRCVGTLVSDLNRSADYLTPPWDALEALAYSPELEDTLIQDLIQKNAQYPDDLPYACRPEQNPGFYNSNSFAHGLLNAVGLAGPRFPDRLPMLVPGWLTPVPGSKFQ